MNADSLLADVPDALAQELNQQAIKLIDQLKSESEEVSETQSRFRPHLFRGEIRVNRDETTLMHTKSIINIEGHEMARYFQISGQWLGLTGSSYDSLINICRLLYSLHPIEVSVSLTVLIDAAFEWLSRTYDTNKNLPLGSKNTVAFVTSVIGLCAPKIQPVEIWIPLEGMYVDESFRIGSVTFKQVSKEEFNKWLGQWDLYWTQDVHPKQRRVMEFFTNIAALIDAGKMAVGILSVNAEPTRAVEHAMSEVEQSLSALRFYSMSNFYPSGRSGFAIAGTLHDDVVRHLLIQNQKLLGEGGTSDEWPYRSPERFDTASLSKMREFGLSKIDRMLRKESHQRTPYENQILKTIAIYDRSTLTRDTRDKLLNIVVALESILLRKDEGSLRKTVSHRMAYLLGKSLGHRRHIIETYDKAYEARSNFVHRGEDPKDMEMLADFLDEAWHVLRILIENKAQYTTTGEMLDSLDDIKFIEPSKFSDS